jgi:hypothetical protein
MNSTHSHVDLTIPGHLSLGGLFWWRLSDIIYPPNLRILFWIVVKSRSSVFAVGNTIYVLWGAPLVDRRKI